MSSSIPSNPLPSNFSGNPSAKTKANPSTVPQFGAVTVSDTTHFGASQERPIHEIPIQQIPAKEHGLRLWERTKGGLAGSWKGLVKNHKMKDAGIGLLITLVTLPFAWWIPGHQVFLPAMYFMAARGVRAAWGLGKGLIKPAAFLKPKVH